MPWRRNNSPIAASVYQGGIYQNNKRAEMLPRMLYELLPFIYLGVGLGGSVLINSAIVFIASILLSMAGILVLTMRIRYRRQIRRRW